MDGDLDMDTVEKVWKKGSRNEVRRLEKDENGLSGMANYIVKEKTRIKSEKRWNSSTNLMQPGIKVVHSKPSAAGGRYKPIASYVDGWSRTETQFRSSLKSGIEILISRIQRSISTILTACSTYTQD